MGTARANVRRKQLRLKLWGEKLAELVAEAEEGGAEVTNDYFDRLQELQSKYTLAQTRLLELETASTTNADRYEHLRSGVELAWNQLEAAIGRLARQAERGEQ